MSKPRLTSSDYERQEEDSSWLEMEDLEARRFAEEWPQERTVRPLEMYEHGSTCPCRGCE